MDILSKIKHCQECIHSLPFSPKPILQYSPQANIIIVGQAPGLTAHQTGKPWNDASGQRLRHWLNLSEQQFYNEKLLSIVPMGFCYPGRGKSGDLPPRPECATKWHSSLVKADDTKVILLIGKYAQDYYLRDKHTLTTRIKNWQQYAPQFLLLPHPSPRNNIWLKKHSWFESEILPEIRQRLNAITENGQQDT